MSAVPEFHDAMPDDWIAPGETTTVAVEGHPFAIANAEGEFFAFQHMCPHQATELGGVPLIRKFLLVCPQHHSIFDVRSGECVMASDDGFKANLAVYPTRVVDGVVQVEF